MGLFDLHAHLTDPRLAPDEDEVLARARAAGVTTIVSNGLHVEDNLRVLALAARADIVRPALGLYPVDAVLPEMEALGVDYPRSSDVPPDDAIAWVEQHVEQAVAVGEVGLDHHWVPSELWDLQEQRFRRLVRVAIEAERPLIVHSRRAERRTFDVLRDEGATRVNWHCYSSKLKLAAEIAEAGHYLSIPANVGRSQSFRHMLERLPRERLLLETDCPYMGPDRDARNEPANVALTVQVAAEAWQQPVDAVIRRFEENFEVLMGFTP